jgi:hypothetical protein
VYEDTGLFGMVQLQAVEPLVTLPVPVAVGQLGVVLLGSYDPVQRVPAPTLFRYSVQSVSA